MEGGSEGRKREGGREGRKGELDLAISSLHFQAKMSGFQGYLTKELPVKQRDMATLKDTHRQLQEQAAKKKKGPAVPEELTFELLEAEWTGLEKENKECQVAMERELER